jgi:hypothetical protein
MVAYCVRVYLTDRNLSNSIELGLVINLPKLQSHNLDRGFFFGKHFSLQNGHLAKSSLIYSADSETAMGGREIRFCKTIS